MEKTTVISISIENMELIDANFTPLYIYTFRHLKRRFFLNFFLNY